MFKKTKFYDILDHSSIYVSVHAALSDSRANKGSNTKTVVAEECCVNINDESLEKVQEVISLNFDISYITQNVGFNKDMQLHQFYRAFQLKIC